jgi:formylglycine-generating enzyme required for sulfatase activity
MRLVYSTALRFGWLASFVAAHVLAVTEAWGASEPRVALVIGNGNYAEGRLPNPPQDAVVIARTMLAELARDVAQARRPAKPVMVRVPAGGFYYGCNESVDGECYDDEKPGRRITLREFKIDKTEVTVSAYEACVLAGACREPGSDGPCNWGKSGREAHPINCVNWYQARAYCAWAGKRLPTEQEWEKAARGTDGRIYPWGNERASCAHAVMDDGSGNGCGRGNLTWPVGSKPSGASPYGALDMAGNVWEWTSSWFESQQPARAVVRGGPWRRNPRYLRASNRGWANPVLMYGGSGFRCAQ